MEVAKILFLHLMRAYGPLPIPLKEFAKAANEHAKWIKKLEKQGIIKFTAAYIGRRARVIIFDVKSDEQLFETINADPLFPYTERETYPLISSEKVYDIYEKLAKDL
jgi:muconolactone delta-isomerase